MGTPDVRIEIGEHAFDGWFEAAAPATVAVFRAMLPFEAQLLHVRWSGEGVWIPLGDRRFDFPFENTTRYPAPGQFIFYPGGPSESEILLGYGGCAFASKAGALAANHFLTLRDPDGLLPEIGRGILSGGARRVAFAQTS